MSEPIKREGLLKSDRTSFKVALEKILTDGRARTDFSHVPQIVASIREHGGLLHPITVVKADNDHFRLVAGECRYRAHLIASMDDERFSYIECVLRDDLTPLAQKELELEENVIRKDLEWPERIEALRQIDELKRKKNDELLTNGDPLAKKDWIILDTANEVGMEVSHVRKQITFAKDLKDRPDLAVQVMALPLLQAMREFGRKVDAETLTKRTILGEIKLSTNLKLGSCIDLIKEVKNDSIDMVLTDPPFGNREIEAQEGINRGIVQSYTQLLKSNDNSNTKEVIALLTTLAPELFRVMKPASHLYIFYSSELHETLLNIYSSAGFEVQPWPIIWEKTNTTAPFRGYNFMPCYEPILFAHKPDGDKRRRMNEPAKSILKYQTLSSNSKTHPFQKPQALLEYLIKLSTHTSQLVLDPFAGSASTIKAAIATGRSALGFEIDQQRFNDAQNLLLKGL